MGQQVARRGPFEAVEGRVVSLRACLLVQIGVVDALERVVSLADDLAPLVREACLAEVVDELE